MSNRIAYGLATASLAVLVLAGCAASPAPVADDTETPSASAAPAVLTVAESALGEIIVDGEGMTVYVFDKDSVGTDTSACTGECAAKWPIVTVESGDLVVEGVTGELDTITAPDGSLQLTLEGLPLYYFANDVAPGDTFGQAVNDVWWVVAPDGTKIKP